MKKIVFSVLFVVLAFAQSFACTSVLVTRKASANGSTMITYAADSHTRYGDLYYLQQVSEHLREGNGAMIEYSETSMFWLFNFVTNYAYTRYSDMIKDIRKEQYNLETGFVKDAKAFDEEILRAVKEGKSEAEIKNLMTTFSNQRVKRTFDTWTKLKHYLLVKYIDGNVKKEADGKFIENPYRKGQCVSPSQPQYPEKWYRTIVKDNGEVLKVK